MSLLTHELWARAILAIGALVVVPLGLFLVNRRGHAAPSLNAAGRIIHYVQLPAALVLAAAQLLSPGTFAAALTVPWLLVTAIVALGGLSLAWRCRRGPLPAFVAACGMMFLAIGGGWALADRAGIRPLSFDPAIVLLTAVHFHYAGFALPILTALAIHRVPGRLPWSIAFGVVASVPLTAVGITATQLSLSPICETIAAWCMSVSGLGVAWLYVRLAFLPETPRISRELWAFGGLFLACGMLLSILYGSRWLMPLPWLDIPTMRALHGTANAVGFTVPSMLGWMVGSRRDSTLLPQSPGRS